MNKKVSRIKELSAKLTAAAKTYYQENREIMSNYEYDKRYDELVALERETGTVLSNSPTQRVGYEVLSELPKERHEMPMLSLDKTKSATDLQEWLGERTGLLSWKLDGLTVVLSYEGGSLKKAVTRGNGEIGEVITSNARVFANIPVNISFQGKLWLRGEAVIRYSEFNRINEAIGDADAKYKNPRNLCSGSVRQLNSRITAERHVNFEAFELVSAEGIDFKNSRNEQFEWLKGQGFDVVEYKLVTAKMLPKAVGGFAAAIQDYDIPSDGLVLLFEDIAYGESLGRTAKFPRDAIALKWEDEIKKTKLRHIEWSPSRTGLINPVAVFDPVELEGTTMSRASVHNLSVMESLALGEGDCITVYKANMIIPQIADNLTRSGNIRIPGECPFCMGKTEVWRVGEVRSLHCTNPDCPAKRIKSCALFVSRDALNIEGLSEATLEKFIGAGFIKEFADIFRLGRYEEEIAQMEGFGKKSCDNLLKAIKAASHTTLSRVIYGLGVPGIGLANAKLLCQNFQYDFDHMRRASQEELLAIDGIGDILADAWIAFFSDEKKKEMIDQLLGQLMMEREGESSEAAVLDGMTFVITGKVDHFANRKKLQEAIEAHGGKTTGTVTSKTSYLINNDVDSNSSKNKKAKELGVPIISEEDFLKLQRE